MSYNITGLKRRSIHLELPLDFDFQAWVRAQPVRTEQGYENIGRRWCLEENAAIAVNLAEHTWKLGIFNQELSGRVEDNALVCYALDWTGEGSGNLYSDILLPLFKEFKGSLSALVVWEGGDSVYQLDIHDGVISDVEIK